MVKIKYYIICVLVLLSTAEVFAGSVQFPGEKHLRRWSNSDGLPHNTILTALQTTSGYIWLGTPSGLCRFDGCRIENFNVTNSGLDNDHITVLYEGIDDDLWIGTDAGGVAVLRQNHWTSFSTENGLSFNQVRAITQDWHGFIWVGTSYGLNRIGPEGIRIFTRDDGLADNIITALTVDLTGRLWIGTLRGGLAYYDENMIQPFGYREGLSVSTITSLFTDKRGMIWIGSRDGLFALDPREELIRPIPGTVSSPITKITESPDGHIWIATMADGIKKLQGESAISFTPDGGFPDEYVHTLFFDQDSSMWIGTGSQGLFQWLDTPVSMIPSPDKVITAVLRDHEEGLWIGTRNDGVFRIIGNRVHDIFDQKTGLPGERIKALYQDRKNRLWIITEDAGLICMEGSRFSTIVSPHILASPNITSFTQDTSGEFWVGTDRGFYRLSGTDLSGPFLSELQIRVLLAAGDGLLFAGTSSGVWKSDRFQDTAFSLISLTREINVSALHLKPDGTLLIGSHSRGLFYLQDDSLHNLTTRNGLPDDHILSIACDDSENIWLGTFKGIIGIPRLEMRGYLSGRSGYVRTVWFDESDGMKTRQCTAHAIPGITKDQSGKLYFATMDGIAMLDPFKPEHDQKVEPVIENMYPITEDLLDIQITAFDYLAPGKLHFRHRLDLSDSVYHYLPPGQSRKIRYNNLNPGDYRLIVQTAGNHSDWQNPPLVLSLSIPMPWYRKPLSLASVAAFLSLILTGGWLYRKRLARLRRENKYRTLSIDPGRTADIIQKLDRIMQQERPFLNPDLNIGDLARKMNIHTNHLSRIINEHYGLGYNDFINRLRIETVKERLADPENRYKTILEIMYDTGFYSKSVFNTAFKKFSGVTPSAYRRRMFTI